jgi:hypothetical protein
MQGHENKEKREKEQKVVMCTKYKVDKIQGEKKKPEKGQNTYFV